MPQNCKISQRRLLLAQKRGRRFRSMPSTESRPRRPLNPVSPKKWTPCCRNGWSAWPGTSGRHPSESPVGMARITHLSEVLGRSWRGSMLAECINSLLRPVLDKRKHTDQGCLELFRLLHNVRPFERGKRADHSPAELVGLDVPDDPLILLGLAPKVYI